MKTAVTNVLKASFAMVAGWTFAIFFLISSVALITQAGSFV